MSGPGIVVAGLRERYGATQALDGMSFTVNPGLVTGFVGPNGGRQVHHDAGDPRSGRDR